ncbi:uncharacterized protein LOC122028542 isoform X1 [Zingiber officinale]|uniref:Uncharacterized protein n=1 Tax=Zingiber officinale TaxID=94328 RepID=A0A8J5EVB1_ZINOF|nr:uncharacterized protein LOC122028542 isoform X1 [Zingiber officinale]KAG6472774.1 hypothetical protein ZIOFF_070252 [Zingiber officinale]
MGNCQASEVAMVVIQHPGGKVERLYWPTSAADVMKSNPGYCVALVTHSVSEQKQDGGGIVRFTRVRLLKPKDMLLLGQVYRLITSQEVTQAVMQRKHDKLRKNQLQRDEEHRRNAQVVETAREEQQEDSENKFQMTREDRDRRTSSTRTAARGRHWRPSLQSISEAVS